MELNAAIILQQWHAAERNAVRSLVLVCVCFVSRPSAVATCGRPGRGHSCSVEKFISSLCFSFSDLLASPPSAQTHSSHGAFPSKELLNGKNPEKEPQQTATTGKSGRKCCVYRIGVQNSSILLSKSIFRCIVSPEGRTGKENITRNKNIDEKIIFFVLVLPEIVAGHTSSRLRHAQALIRFLWKMLLLSAFYRVQGALISPRVSTHVISICISTQCKHVDRLLSSARLFAALLCAFEIEIEHR